MSQTTRAFLMTVLAEEMNLEVSEADLSDDLPLGSSGLALESLNFTELVMHAERTLKVSIPDADIDKIASFTVGELIDYLDARLEQAAPR
ncbi:MAG: acyl carrier protein [Jatrophihabitans sp.]